MVDTSPDRYECPYENKITPISRLLAKALKRDHTHANVVLQARCIRLRTLENDHVQLRVTTLMGI